MLLEDRYQLEEPLGRGAMGEVWRAADHVLNRTVAVKVLRGDDAAALERFRMEAQTAGSLSHPNVVGVYDFGSHQGRPYLVMELVDGWNLSQERSVYGVLAPREAAGIAAQMAAGLAAAHRQGVIHRDVKPANVMLTTERTVKLTDFGIARFADATAGTITATGKIVGSAAYLAPERALGDSAQPASDVYSLGCVLYELLTGRPPSAAPPRWPWCSSMSTPSRHRPRTCVPTYRRRWPTTSCTCLPRTRRTVLPPTRRPPGSRPGSSRGIRRNRNRTTRALRLLRPPCRPLRNPGRPSVAHVHHDAGAASRRRKPCWAP
ncbi:protein kinase [Streptomyces chiangmaiensis]